jgi:magnesium chelatase family protein
MSDDATRLVDDQLWEGQLTRRGVSRVHRLAWTVADLAGVDRPGVAEAEVALRLRAGRPLLAATVRRAAG